MAAVNKFIIFPPTVEVSCFVLVTAVSMFVLVTYVSGGICSWSEPLE